MKVTLRLSILAAPPIARFQVSGPEGLERRPDHYGLHQSQLNDHQPDVGSSLLQLAAFFHRICGMTASCSGLHVVSYVSFAMNVLVLASDYSSTVYGPCFCILLVSYSEQHSSRRSSLAGRVVCLFRHALVIPASSLVSTRTLVLLCQSDRLALSRQQLTSTSARDLASEYTVYPDSCASP